MVVLPQPECPIRHTNSPCSTARCTFSNTVVAAPSRPVKRLAMPSMRISGSLIFRFSLLDARCSLLVERRSAQRLAPETRNEKRFTFYSGKVTSFVRRASERSSIMPTRPMARMPLMMLAIERLFHSFHTK